NERPLNAAQDVTAVQYNYTRSLYDFANLEGNIAGCHDSPMKGVATADDPYPKIINCPAASYIDQGLGFLEDRTNNRTSAVLALTQRVKAAGQHVFKAGLDIEFSTYNSGRRFTGGSFLSKDSADTVDDTGMTIFAPFTLNQY